MTAVPDGHDPESFACRCFQSKLGSILESGRHAILNSGKPELLEIVGVKCYLVEHPTAWSG